LIGNPKIVLTDAAIKDAIQMISAKAYPPQLIEAIIAVESNGNASAISESGATGLMQILPSSRRAIINDDRYADKFSAIEDKYGLDSVAYNVAVGVAIFSEQLRVIDVYAKPKTSEIKEKYTYMGFDLGAHSDNYYLALRGYKDGTGAIKNHAKSNANDGHFYPEKIAAYLLFQASQHEAQPEERQAYLDSYHRLKFDTKRSGHEAEFESKLAIAYEGYKNNGDFKAYAQGKAPIDFSQAYDNINIAPEILLALSSNKVSADILASNDASNNASPSANIPRIAGKTATSTPQP
jgi:hypothetical protein